MLDYVGRYTHRVAISNERLVDLEGGHVQFQYKDYRAKSAPQGKTMTLPATEFIRRFLLHVLPVGFHRIRHDGFLGNRVRREKLAQARHLLHMPAPVPVDHAPEPDYRDRCEGLTGVSLRACPVCAQGQMRLVEYVIGQAPAITDTS